ncbi:MAG: 23S rRNA (uracil(1939)-C(5))-methyltransferase RlmD, partial [Candidatus Eremiobacteraeota bacterium]|nr:23S rRNA (uracil(1939)-C(5))-methyltransferase RlmD [Candidatus Eremiobacteraeota bacterium]
MTTSGTPSVPLRVGAEVELTFNDLLTNGQAVGRAAGMVVFVFGPLPQERARVRITAVKPKYAVGELVALLARSRYRVQPFCPVFGACGGCQVQHFSYAAQLAWKRGVVEGALKRIGGFATVRVRDPIGMISPRNYRNKMSLVVDHSVEPPTLGFYKQRSHEVVPIEGCPIVEPQLDDFIGRLNEMRTTRDLEPAFKETRHVVARTAKATSQTVLTLTTAKQSEGVKNAASALMANLPGAIGVTNSFDLSGENVILGRKQMTVAGRNNIEEMIHGVRYRISANSFFQVNTEIVSRILSFMEPGLREPRKIVDLYCGVGTFSLFFAKIGSSVYGIEENAHAIREAKENAELNGIGDRVRFEAGRVEELLRRPAIRKELQQAEIVFLDPPRKGSDEETLGAIAEANVQNLWYLSCDPATLARDLKFLASKGYRLGVVQPFDMFPQTGHIETLVTLYREVSLSHEATLEEEQTGDPFPDDAPLPS